MTAMMHPTGRGGRDVRGARGVSGMQSTPRTIGTIGSIGSIAARSRGLALLFTLVAAACGDSPAGPSREGPSTLVVEVDDIRIESLGETFTIHARVLDAHGREMSGVALDLSARTPGVVEALGQANFRSVANGRTEIHVRLADGTRAGPLGERLEAVVQVEVAQRATALAVGPWSAAGGGAGEVVHAWALGEQVALPVWTMDARGRPMDRVLANLSWSTASPLVAAVSTEGMMTAMGDGITTVHANGGGLSGEVNVEVRASLSLQACAAFARVPGGVVEDASCGELGLTFTRASR
jgi:hypothetical protein